MTRRNAPFVLLLLYMSFWSQNPALGPVGKDSTRLLANSDHIEVLEYG